MKKLILSVLAASLVMIASGKSILPTPEKVLTSFNKIFPDAAKAVWTEDAEGYHVYFEKGDIKFRLQYNDEGVVTKSIRYYSAELLPPMILSSVKHKYSDKRIFGITEVTTAAALEYHIVLEDDKKWYNIVSDPTGNLSLKNKYNKG